MRIEDRIDKVTDRQRARQTCAMEHDPFKSEVVSLEGKQAGMQCVVPRAIPRNYRAAEGVGSVRAAGICSSTEIAASLISQHQPEPASPLSLDPLS